MSRYAIVNLMDVKESVSGMADGIEGRFARSLLDSRELGVSHFRYAPKGLPQPDGPTMCPSSSRRRPT